MPNDEISKIFAGVLGRMGFRPVPKALVQLPAGARLLARPGVAFLVITEAFLNRLGEQEQAALLTGRLHEGVAKAKSWFGRLPTSSSQFTKTALLREPRPPSNAWGFASLQLPLSPRSRRWQPQSMIITKIHSRRCARAAGPRSPGYRQYTRPLKIDAGDQGGRPRACGLGFAARWVLLHPLRPAACWSLKALRYGTLLALPLAVPHIGIGFEHAAARVFRR